MKHNISSTEYFKDAPQKNIGSVHIVDRNSKTITSATTMYHASCTYARDSSVIRSVIHKKSW